MKRKSFILVTGTAGFIGFNLSMSLLKDKKRIIGIDNVNDYYSVQLKKNRINQLKKFKNFKFHKVDLANYKALNNIFTKYKIEKIIHLAAQAGVRYSIIQPKKYLKSNSPDIVLLQEIKTLEENYPHEEIKKSGYFSYVKGQKSYNGVSILSKKKLTVLNSDLPGDKIKQSRFLSCEIKVKNKKINLINIYVPNGNPVETEKYNYKIKWLDLLITYIEKKLKESNNIILCGDFNIIPEEIDVYNHNKYINEQDN